MPPTNISFATALDIGTVLPFSITQDPSGLVGPDYKLYYKYTAQPTDFMMGVWAKAPVTSNYQTFMIIYTETSPGVWSEYELFIEPFQVPCEVPVTPGTTYFFEVSQDAGILPDASLTFLVDLPPNLSIPIGSLLISDFSPGWPGAVISPVDGTRLQYKPIIPSADYGDILPSGIMGWLDNSANPFVEKIINELFALVASRNGLTNNNTGQQIRANGVNKFYVAKSTAFASAIVGTIDTIGTEIPNLWTLPITSKSIVGMAPNRLDTILYFGAINGGTDAVQRFDLVNNVPLSDLVAAIPNYTIRKDILVMSDGNILVSYEDHLAPVDEFVKRYSPAGALLNTYTLPTGEALDRIGLDKDDSADTFWMMSFPNNQIMRFRQIRISDGVTLVTFDVTVFTNGVSEQTFAESMDRFGISNCCPLVVLRTEIVPPVAPNLNSGIYRVVPGKRQDTLWTQDFAGTEDVKIPNPTARLGYVG